MLVIEALGEALCCGCLRVLPAHPTNEGVCPVCGADTCNCPDCLAVIARLRAGRRGRLGGALLVSIVDWSESGGSVLAGQGDQAGGRAGVQFAGALESNLGGVGGSHG